MTKYNWILISQRDSKHTRIKLPVLLQNTIEGEIGTPQLCLFDTDSLTMPRLLSEFVKKDLNNVGCLGGSANKTQGDSHHQRLEKLAPLNCLSLLRSLFTSGRLIQTLLKPYLFVTFRVGGNVASYFFRTQQGLLFVAAPEKEWGAPTPVSGSENGAVKKPKTAPATTTKQGETRAAENKYIGNVNEWFRPSARHKNIQ